MKMTIVGRLFLLVSFFHAALFCGPYPVHVLDEVASCDVELLTNGGYAPLKGFLNQKDYLSVLENERLSDGKVWPLPVVLPATAEKAQKYLEAGHVLLLDQNNYPVAVLDVEEVYSPDVEKECLSIFGCLDDEHFYVKKIKGYRDGLYVGGTVRALSEPPHFDFRPYRLSASECKRLFQERGWDCVVGFQTRNPMHQSHVALTKYCMDLLKDKNAKLLLHPIVGPSQPGDIDPVTRVKCYLEALDSYPEGSVQLALLPYAMRMAGPREALMHALIRKNYGCTHFIVGRDHAGPSVLKKNGERFWEPYDAQEHVKKFSGEIGIEPVFSDELVYVEESDQYIPASQVGSRMYRNLSGTALRKLLEEGRPIPSWFSYPKVVDVLRESAQRKGICFYFVGLSGAGKSTLCNVLKPLFEERLKKNVVLLDGDEVRKFINPQLGYARSDRSINIRRIGYLSSLIVDAGGVCLTANMAPYHEDRAYNRQLISSKGKYVEVFVNSSLSSCKNRDLKGIYAGSLSHVIGVDEPFEEPQNAEIVINGDGTLEEMVESFLTQVKALFPGLLD